MRDRRYDVVLVASARRALLSLPARTQRRIIRSLRALEGGDPRPHGAVPLAGQPGERVWRIRIEDYRVLYELHDDRLVVLVIRIGHRRDV